MMVAKPAQFSQAADDEQPNFPYGNGAVHARNEDTVIGNTRPPNHVSRLVRPRKGTRYNKTTNFLSFSSLARHFVSADVSTEKQSAAYWPGAQWEINSFCVLEF